MQGFNSHFFTSLLLVSSFVCALDQAVLVLKNISQFPLYVELKRVSEFAKDQKKIVLNQKQTLPVFPFVNVNDGTQAASAARVNPFAIYQMVIHFDPTLKVAPMVLDSAELAHQLKTCLKKNNNEVVSVSIDIEEQRAAFGLWNSWVPQITYNCGNYPHAAEISCGWFDLEEKKSDDICPIDKPSAQKVISEIKRQNPGWTEQQARNLYDRIRLQSLIEADLYEGFKNFKSHFYFASINEKIKQITDLVSGQIPQVTAHESGAYVIFSAPGFFTPPPPVRYEMPQYQKVAATAKGQAIAQELVKAYKIHLMPEQGWQNTLNATQTLVNTLAHDPELRTLINAFKVRLGITIPTEGVVMPTIVLYVFGGKEDAQKALDKIYEVFKNTKGLAISPRFNTRVTDFIYAAQGDGQYKTGDFTKYYEQPYQIYYRPDFTGTMTDYHLKHPQTGNELFW